MEMRRLLKILMHATKTMRILDGTEERKVVIVMKLKRENHEEKRKINLPRGLREKGRQGLNIMTIHTHKKKKIK